MIDRVEKWQKQQEETDSERLTGDELEPVKRNRPNLTIILGTQRRFTKAACHVARQDTNLASTSSFDMLRICDPDMCSTGMLKWHVQTCPVKQATICTLSVPHLNQAIAGN